MLCLLLITSSSDARTLRIFVLTGQSNSLGTPATTATNMVLPRVLDHSADAQVPFYWDNTADGTLAGDAGLGDSSGQWTNLCPQLGGYYALSAEHWGPEIGFGRLLWDAGYRDFGIVKASCGGGGNSFWEKTNADHHMYDKVVSTVSNAVRILPPGFTNHQVVGLLYLQGESNSTTEAAEADVRFASLLANLRADLPNASGMKAVIGQIASDTSSTRLTTTQKQSALAAARSDIGYAPATGLAVHNVDGLNVHYAADSLIVLGERMASEALLLGALPEPVLPEANALCAWYRADHGVVPTSDSAFTRWDELLSGATNRDLSQVVGTPQRVNFTNLSTMGRAFVRFTGAGQATWSKVADFGSLTGPRTLVFAARVTGSGDGFLFDGSTAPGMTRAQVRTNTWQVGVQPSPIGNAPNPDTPTAPRILNAWQFHEFSFVPTNGGTVVRHWINGTNLASFTDSHTNALGGLILAANAQAQRFLAVDIAEVLIYTNELSSTARLSVLAHLQSGWPGILADTNVPPESNLPPFVPVFSSGEAGYTCYRIPALVTTTHGTLIAVADGRIGGCGDIPTPLDLVCRRSFDNGDSWGPLQVIADYGSNPSDTDTYPFYAVSNITRVAAGDAALLLDRANGRVWTLYDNGGVLSGTRKIKLELRYSGDDGATWSAAIDLEAQNPGLRPSSGEFLAGPGNGIQLTEGPNAGRLIFPVYTYGSSSASMVIYSDDHGGTWKRGTSIANGGEIQVAETPGGGLIASVRDNGFAYSGVRTFSRSADGGLTWGASFTNTVNPPTIPDPACQGCIYRLTTTNEDSASRIIHANAAHVSSRVNMTLRISYDEGASWPVSNQVYAAGSAYSAVTKLATGEMGLLFEKDPYGSLVFTRRSVSQLTAGADSLPPYTVWAGEHFTPVQLMNRVISGPEADPDGDGYTNQAEFTAGTDPLNSASRLDLRLTVTSTNALLNFNAVANRVYVVQACATLNPEDWWTFLDVNPRPSNGFVQLAVALTNRAEFFRLTARQSP